MPPTAHDRSSHGAGTQRPTHRKRNKRLTLIALLALGTIDPAWPQASDLDLQSFDLLWTTVRDTHWQKQPGGLDWEAMREEYRPQVERAASTEEARAVMNAMLARLNQTHFGVVPGRVYSELETESAGGPATAGIELRVLNGEAVVTRVDAGSDAEAKGVHPGWIVREAGGKPLKTVIEEANAAASNATSHIGELQLTRALEARLSGNPGEAVDILFADGDGRDVRLALKLRTPRGQLTSFGNLPPQYMWLEERRLGSNQDIGYLRFNIFLDVPRLIPAFEKFVNGCLDCRGLIIDLRGNPGGIGGMAMGLSGFLVGKAGSKLGTMATRDSQLNFVVNPRAKVFQGPVAMLVDANSASTSEFFAGGLQDLGRARVFGTRTAGAALPSVFMRLPNGDGFQYAVANYVSVNGKTLEGEGVLPDEEVRLTRAGLLAGHDAVVDAAVEWIGRQK